VIAWHLGRRTSKDTLEFTQKMRKATVCHFQLTTDGFSPYRDAVSYSLGMRVDFAQLVTVYAGAREGEQRYSPAEIVEAIRVPRTGNPDPKKICTSHVERQNLTTPMQIRRLTRLTNAFSRKWSNLRATLALHFAFYNFWANWFRGFVTFHLLEAVARRILSTFPPKPSAPPQYYSVTGNAIIQLPSM
jgi:IS1 family transposase